MLGQYQRARLVLACMVAAASLVALALELTKPFPVVLPPGMASPGGSNPSGLAVEAGGNTWEHFNKASLMGPRKAVKPSLDAYDHRFQHPIKQHLRHPPAPANSFEQQFDHQMQQRLHQEFEVTRAKRLREEAQYKQYISKVGNFPKHKKNVVKGGKVVKAVKAAPKDSLDELVHHYKASIGWKGEKVYSEKHSPRLRQAARTDQLRVVDQHPQRRAKPARRQRPIHKESRRQLARDRARRRQELRRRRKFESEVRAAYSGESRRRSQRSERRDSASDRSEETGVHEARRRALRRARDSDGHRRSHRRERDARRHSREARHRRVRSPDTRRPFKEVRRGESESLRQERSRRSVRPHIDERRDREADNRRDERRVRSVRAHVDRRDGRLNREADNRRAERRRRVRGQQLREVDAHDGRQDVGRNTRKEAAVSKQELNQWASFTAGLGLGGGDSKPSKKAEDKAQALISDESTFFDG
mmetsp:Transcript_5966/g.13569  ORF Transcript_5966/g.13569 Transcript_5966/m.13569 type:complete len:475 (-) Transcript_5966:78-1502(-)|eukprot:CAMPEP_0114559336 /NCGR_PEP_ID=MMETSP0114-20121206/10869_1 /TAXON_ID=31324 /ORGANISM="Goniomonas sp, Strain m" /LENGTH=474 /DNA_ID=CAMNT_0001744803 /DNA_START=26 /DNA_END=1450 /DNA_ORIENTATION=-